MSDRDLRTSRTQVFGPAPEKGTRCRVCGRNVDDGRATYCSDYCRSIASAVMDLLNWTGVRRRVVDRDDATCRWCGFKQEWLDRGYDHLREIVESKLPPEPETPSVLRIGDGDVSDDELARAREARNDWRDERKALIGEYFNKDDWAYLTWPAPESRLEVDHIVPVSAGGHPFDPANLQTLCRDCHKEKTAAEATGRAEQADRPGVTLMDFGQSSRKPRVENSYQRPPRCPECGGETRVGPKHGAAVVECRDCEYRGRFYPINPSGGDPDP